MAEAQVFTADATQEVIDSVVKSIPADEIDATFKSDSIGNVPKTENLPIHPLAQTEQQTRQTRPQV